jgi:hypothetical protein
MILLARVAIGVIAATALVGGTSWAQWRNVQAPELPGMMVPPPPGAELLSWEVLGAARKLPGAGWSVPAALTASSGKLVTIDGVLFVMPQLVSNGMMEGAVLTPPSRIGCCAITCDPRPERMVYIAMATPLPPPSSKTTPCRVTGRLTLDPSGESWTLASLDGADLTWSHPTR